MKALIALAERLTGKKVRFRTGYWTQDEEAIFVPTDDEEGLLHEILHWVVASDEERTWPNLALDEYDVPDINRSLPPGERLKKWRTQTPTRRERQVCHLTRKVYALRGWGVPSTSSCTAYKVPTRVDKKWADARLASSPTTLEELAGALRSGRCAFGGTSFPTPLQQKAA